MKKNLTNQEVGCYPVKTLLKTHVKKESTAGAVMRWGASYSTLGLCALLQGFSALVFFLSEATIHAGSLSWCALPGSSPNPEIRCFPEGTLRDCSSSFFSSAYAGGIFLQPPLGFWGSLYIVQALCPKANGPVGQEERGKCSGRLSQRSEVFQLHTWAAFCCSGTLCWNRDWQKILVGSRCVWVLGKKVLAMLVI